MGMILLADDTQMSVPVSLLFYSMLYQCNLLAYDTSQMNQSYDLK